MTDILHTLPDFPTKHYAHLIPSLEKNLITTTDLLTLDPLEIAKRAQLPLLDVRRLTNHVLASLQSQLGLQEGRDALQKYEAQADTPTEPALRQSGCSIVQKRNVISTLDQTLDSALGGGILTSYITEITGESGAGKTQLLLTLLLSAQLSPPHGLARPTVYISTEHPLPTTRLTQILAAHPLLASSPSSPSTASLDKIYTLSLPDLESQDHILEYQLPVLLSRHRPGLIVIDSITANYRAVQRCEGSTSGAALGLRSSQLIHLGHLLRQLAREHDCAIVVANQVADRFSPDAASSPPHQHLGSSSPLPSSSPLSNTSQQPQMASLDALIMPAPPPPPSIAQPSSIPTFPRLTLNHQQNFFTGWSCLE
ncbi:MAG: hypothetical protein Q9220_003023 [cf. Caloplaca sp. 1 TL-2023]